VGTHTVLPTAATDGLAVYVVGGAVRDALLGLPAGDRDWVVVGATPEEMTRRGFMPVGGDFPVFLHPETREEYALARTERKSGRGYRGFTFYTGPDVTLADDLRRRDLRINAMARDADGTLIDPLGGLADLHGRVLRHVGPAFSEDPVRILRLARFAARFADFSVAAETLALCRDMVAAGEVDALVPERVWREVSRGLMSEHPARMLDVLADVQALPRVLPGLRCNDAVRVQLARAVKAGLPLPARYAVMCAQSDDPQAVSAHLNTPHDCADHARLLPWLCAQAGATAVATTPDAVLTVIERTDGLRKPERFLSLLAVAALAGSRAQRQGRRACPSRCTRGHQNRRPAGALDGAGGSVLVKREITTGWLDPGRALWLVVTTDRLFACWKITYH